MFSTCFTIYLYVQVAWGILICSFITYNIKVNLGFLQKFIGKEIEEKRKPFRRDEINKWPMLQMYLGATFLLPFRLGWLFGSLVCHYILIWMVNGPNLEMNKESTFRRPIVHWLFYFLARSILFFCAGIIRIEPKQLKIKDFDKDYPDYSSKKSKVAPMIISNHVSWMDPLIMASICSPSMTAKKAIGSIPIFGASFKAMQFILIDRANGARAAIDQIKLRCKMVAEGKKVAPILLFPEGTTTNGKHVISFKKGAFLPREPIKIYALKFDADVFNPFVDEVGDAFLMIMTMCIFMNKLKVYEYDTYFPDHLNLKSDEDWEIYSNKTRKLIIDAIGTENEISAIDCSLEDSLAYSESIGIKTPEVYKKKSSDDKKKE